MKKFLFSLLCLVFLSSQAQITINRTNLPTAGITLNIQSLDQIDLDLGTASDQAQIWDFSSLKDGRFDSLLYLSVPATPYTDSIGSSANFALNIDGQIGGALPLTDNYLFLKEQENGIYGTAIAVNALGEIIVLHTENPELIYPFPIEYGLEITDTSSFNADLTSPVEMSLQRNTIKTIHADAFGSVILEGDTIEVLRVLEEAHVRDDFGTVSEAIEYRYNFYATEPNHKHPLVSVMVNQDQKIDLVTWISSINPNQSSDDTAEDSDTEGNSDDQDSTSSVAELNYLNQIEIYPNPSNGMIHLKASNGTTNIESVKVFNFIGQEVYKSNSINTLSLDLSHLEMGTYFVEIQSENQYRSIKKIQIQ